ncbi:hypothetical protein VT84_09525 [Gemmata sp. SH-PL17]|uniref:hypothetical protein n=1 Tax=Gemmata sp. SH-PL17 TaxID=1630693 RepID=UPI00078E5925|nr:hypothetical protein [Gemmata sp. SH-PL17]AMV24624.1 hypothetical protein VT84_09525 [Gemmata sp. SH-PL17]
MNSDGVVMCAATALVLGTCGGIGSLLLRDLPRQHVVRSGRVAIAIALFVAGTAAIASMPPVQSYSVPAYGGVPLQLLGQQGGMSAADAKRLLEIEEERLVLQRESNELLRAIAIKLEAPLPQAQKKADLFTVAKAKCAACHTPGKSEAKGGSFILFADDAAAALKPLNGAEKRAVKQAVQDGSMPKNGKLSKDEQAAFNW